MFFNRTTMNMECTATVLLAVGAVVACILALLRYLGAIGKIRVYLGKPPVKNIWIAYKLHQGPYEKCGPHFAEVMKTYPGDAPCIGIYYDDPGTVDAAKLQYAVGVVLSEGPTTPPSAIVDLMIKRDYMIAELPEVDSAVKVDFPYRFIMSAWIGAMRVYHYLDKFVKEKELKVRPFIELYKGDKIHYIVPFDFEGFILPGIK